MSTIEESSINVKRQTITKNHPGYLGKVEINITHISVSNYASITFKYDNGDQDVIKFAGKDKLTFLNKRNKKKTFNYNGAGGKTSACKAHHPEWKRNIIIKKTRIAHKLPKLPHNSYAPAGYKPIPGSVPCRCTGNHAGINSCGPGQHPNRAPTGLCCDASPSTATDPNATGYAEYDKRQYYKGKWGNGTLCFETWQNGWSFASSNGVESVTISNDPSEQFLGLLDVKITWRAPDLVKNIASEKEMIARLKALQEDIDNKKRTINSKKEAITNWDVTIGERRGIAQKLSKDIQSSITQRDTYATNNKKALAELKTIQMSLKSKRQLETEAIELIRKANQNKKEANEQLEAMNQEVIKVTQQRNDMVKERNDAISTRNSASQKINDLDRTIHRRNTTIAGLDAEVRGLNATKGQLAAKKQREEGELQRILTSIETKSGILQGIVDHPNMVQIETDIRQLEQKYQTKSGQLQTLREDIEKAEIDEQDARGDLDHAQEELRKEALLLKTKKEEYISMDSKFHRLEASVKTLNTSVESKRKTLSVLEGDITKARTNKVGLEGQVKGLEGQVGGLEGQVEVLEGEFEGLEGEVLDLQGKVGGLEGEVRGLEADEEELEESLDILRTSLLTRETDLDLINKRISSAELEEKSSQEELDRIGRDVLEAQQMLDQKQSEHQTNIDKLNDSSLSSEEIKTIKERVYHSKDETAFAAEVLLEALEEENKQSSGVILKIDHLEEEQKERAAILRGNTAKVKQQIDSLRASLTKRNIQFESPLQAFKDVEKARSQLEDAQLDFQILQQQNPTNVGPQLTKKKQEVEEARQNLKLVSSKVPVLTLNETDSKTIKLLAIAEVEYDHQMKINNLLLKKSDDSLQPTFLKWLALFFAAVIIILLF
jgi:DNA repair exonuclease SbcCD ATPase subunit